MPGSGEKWKDMADYPRIKVIFDNAPYSRELVHGWGFSCIIEKIEKTILFDAGSEGGMLINNMEEVGINPEDIDAVFLSHIHVDHVGGTDSFLAKNSNVTVYLPQSFPESFIGGLQDFGARVQAVEKPVEICSGVYSTGELGSWIKEQSLVIKTGNGLIIITGCAHPGIVDIIRGSIKLWGKEVFLVMGGFHLNGHSRGEIENIVSELRELGVAYVGPCHCSGDDACRIFEQEYGKNFIDIGTGSIIDTKKLEIK
ncbi:MAG: MBL fold metallo-hydrolase [Actinomycetota bacterium]